MNVSELTLAVASRVPANAFVALAAAASWGGGDFSGGMGVKFAGGSTRGALRVIITGHTISLTVMLAVLLAQHSAWPSGAAMWWALGAGVAAGLSLMAFYIALARGAMGASAAISGLLAAAIPVAVSVAVEGAPAGLQAAGFVLAGLAIWIIAAAPTSHDAEGFAPGNSSSGTTWLAVLGGIGFGIYFVGLRQANSLGVMEPIALARAGSLAVCVLLLLVLGRGEGQSADGGTWLNRSALFWAGGVALLDTGGNLLFIASTRLGRLDVAAVLASLYPAGTILLAAWHLHERPTQRQAVGMVLALAAVGMITV